MEKPKQSQKNCFDGSTKRIAALGWLMCLALQAHAQKGMLIIRGEITATTCVIRHIANVSANQEAEPPGNAQQCGELGIKTHLNEWTVNNPVSDHAIATIEQSERIKTVTYR